MLLEHVGEGVGGERIRRAVLATVTDGITTADLGGSASTQRVVQAILERLEDPEGRRTTIEGGIQK
jgi:isocitrate/isopropylmalate dehydrogenase